MRAARRCMRCMGGSSFVASALAARSASNTARLAAQTKSNEVAQRVRVSGVSARRYIGSQGIAEQKLFSPSQEHVMLREMVRKFAEEEVDPQALAYDKAEEFNLALFQEACKTLELPGVTVQQEFGGTGLDATASVIVHEELAAADPGFCLAYLAHSLLFCNNLAVNGNDEQRSRFLPPAIHGDLIGGMCMSEPGAGTDVLGMRTTAREEPDGSFLLNGSKMWITNGAISDSEQGDIFLVYARTGDASTDISLFLLEKGTPGFYVGQRIKDKCGMRASGTAELVFDNVTVPSDNLVGIQNGAVACMMRNLEIERLALAAMSTGIARRCIEVMNRYSQERKAFGEPINRFGQIQDHIATSYAEYMAAKCYVYNTANMLDLNNPATNAADSGRVDSDGVKLVCSKMATTVANRAMQVLGGYGYVGEYQVERLWRDAKLIEIGGGTLEAHQKNMTRDLARLETL